MQSFKITTVLKYLTLIFALLPMAIVALFGYFSMTGFASSSVSQYARFSGSAQSEAINQCIGEYQNDVSYLSVSDEINTYVEQATSNGSVGTELKDLTEKLFKSITDKGEDVLDILILRKDGNIVTLDNNGNVTKDTDKVVFDYFDDINGLSADQIFLSRIFAANERYDTEHFYIAKCILDGADTITGYVLEIVSTSRISNILTQSSYGSGKGYLAVTDGTGTVLNFNGNASQKLDDVSDSALLDILKTTGKKADVTDYTAGSVLGSYGYFTGIVDSGWKWFCVYPSDISMSQILVPMLIAIGSMALLSAACAVLGQLLRKSIVGPIKNMVTSMNEIKEGDREKRIEIRTKNEFKEMAELFNGMLDEVCMSEELHRTISNISDNMLFEWDFHKESMYVSGNFVEKFDINPSEAQLANGKFLDKLMTENYSDTYKRDINTLLKNKTGHSGEYQILTKGGAVVWFSVRVMCVTDRLGEPLRVIGVVTDIDNEKKLELQLSERASYDFLSQLYNRSTFERELQSEIERNAHTKVCVVFIDVDDFKFINDRFGHSVGDEVIKYVSGCIKQRVQGSGFAGRFGGDEFTLCITEPHQIENIESLSLDLIDELYSGYHSELANVSINVKASIGIAFSPEHGEEGSQLIAAADEAMYFVKKNGKANYHIYQPEDSHIDDLQHTL